MQKNIPQTIFIVFKNFIKTLPQGMLYCWVLGGLYAAVMILFDALPFFMPMYVLFLILIMIFSLGIYVVAEYKIVNAPENPVLEGFEQSWVRFFPMCAFLFVAGAAGAVLFGLQPLSYIFAAIVFVGMPVIIFLIPSILLREEGPIAAFSVAFNFVKGNYLTTFVHCIIMAVLTAGIAFGSSFLFSMVTVAAFGSDAGNISFYSANGAAALFNGGVKGLIVIAAAAVLKPLPLLFNVVYTVTLMLNIEHRLDGNPGIKNSRKKLKSYAGLTPEEKAYVTAPSGAPGIMEGLPAHKTSQPQNTDEVHDIKIEK